MPEIQQPVGAWMLIALGRSCTTSDTVLVRMAGSNLPDVPRHGVPAEVQADQQWFWRPEWLWGEHRADEDIAAGRVETYSSDEEFLASF